MKKTFLPFLILTLYSLFPLITNSQSLTTTPECVAYDSISNRFFVSSLMSGKIVAIDSLGNKSIFKSGLGYAAGSTICGNVIYVSTLATKYVKGFDLTTGAQVMNINIPSAHQLDGMTTDTSGYLYVADYDYTGTNDQIFKIKLSTQSYSLFISPGQGLVRMPQDIFYDKPNNRLIVVSASANSPVQAINLIDSAVTNILPTSVGDFDGIEMSSEGDYYLTTWATNSLIKYDHAFANSPVTILTGLNGPSNLCYSRKKNVLAVPVYYADTVLFIQPGSTGINQLLEIKKNFRLNQNYPNPFNPVTKIEYYIPQNAIANLVIYDVLGRKICTLVDNKFRSAGNYITEFDGSNLASGLYFYRLTVESRSSGAGEEKTFSAIKMMVLIK
jgi:hypothetical protein